MAEKHDYITEIAYPAQFHREHAPVWLDAVLAGLGRRAPAGEGRVYCELGCGSGFGLLLLAATNPSVTFHGVDINPRHIDEAKSLAAEARLENVRFHCADLRGIATFDACDYIIVRGIYSWVGHDVRAAINAFISRHLSPSGVALIHYMALPGAADMVPVQRLFRSLQRRAGHDPVAAIETGRALLNGLIEGRAGFFEAHPVARVKLAQEQRDAIGHTIHDYLNDDYEPLLSADVIGAMEQLQLAFAGSAAPLENLDDFTVPGSMRALVNAQSGIAMREVTKDFASNQFSRIDLYMRGGAALSKDEHVAALRRLKVRALVGLPEAGGVIFDTRIGPVEGPARIFGPMIARLRAQAVVTFGEMERVPPFAGQPGLVNQAFHALIGSGAVHPVPEKDVEPDPARRLNAVLLDGRRHGRPTPALASHLIGSGVSVGPDDVDALAAGKPVRDTLSPLLP